MTNPFRIIVRMRKNQTRARNHVSIGFFFFQFPIKGEREGRERRKGRAIEQQLTTSRSSSRGSFFPGYQRTPRTYFNLSREYQLLTYSLDFSITKIGSKRLVVIYPLWGRERSLDDTDTTMVIIDATNIKIAAQMAALQNLRSYIK